MARTNYGIKEKGKSRFIIVAPHAAGDDLRTGKVTQNIAGQLKASLVINKKYVKRTNSKAGIKPVRDFNRLPLIKGVYKWGKKQGSRHMKEFYSDIMDFVKSIHQRKEKPVIVFIHGMRNGKDKIKIDIGFGVKEYKGKLLGTRGARKHPDAGSNKGVVRANRKDMINLKKHLNSYDLKIGIGEAERFNKNGRRLQFTAWSKLNGTQYFSKDLIKIPTYSFQLEIDRSLRNKNKLKNTSKIITDTLKLGYEK